MNAALDIQEHSPVDRARYLPMGQAAGASPVITLRPDGVPRLHLELSEDTVVGDVSIPPGHYDVSVDEAAERVVLRCGSRQHALRAYFRRARERGAGCVARGSAHDGKTQHALLTVRPGNGQEWLC